MADLTPVTLRIHSDVQDLYRELLGHQFGGLAPMLSMDKGAAMYAIAQLIHQGVILSNFVSPASIKVKDFRKLFIDSDQFSNLGLLSLELYDAEAFSQLLDGTQGLSHYLVLDRESTSLMAEALTEWGLACQVKH